MERQLGPSPLLSIATHILLPLMVLLSVFLLMRGHNEPGGGFVGGLIASTGFALYAIADGVEGARRVLRIDPQRLIGFGLLTALASGLLAWLVGLPFMTGLWTAGELPVLGKVGTPLLFDFGVYLVVIGITLTILFSLMES